MSDTSYIEPVVKSQPIRLLDMFVIGPLMIVGGALVVGAGKHKVIGTMLVSTGLTTILYNLINYMRVREMKAGQA